MSNSDAENLPLVLQYLRRTNRRDACHRLERETQIFFDLAYFNRLVLAGAWKEADWYLKGFTKFDENVNSQKIFFSLYQMMFLEALDRSDTVKAVEVLRKYLRPFEATNGEIFTKMCRLLSLDNFREHEGIKDLGHMALTRQELCGTITEAIKVNPALKDKLKFPRTEPLSLRQMIDQNFPLPEPRAPIPSHGVGLNATHSPTQVASIPPTQHLPPLIASARPVQYSLDVLPTNVIMTLLQGSLISTMDFNPTFPTLLLVGTNTGEISVWDLTARQRVFHRIFEIEDGLEAFQMSLESDPAIAANRVKWDSNGIIFGVAFSRNIVHLYSYVGRHKRIKKSEIKAHVGGVNDIVFFRPHGPLYVITCGDDRTIKVWNAESTGLVRTFEGHTAPVYSVLPHSRNGCHFILSSSMDGRRKVWPYDVRNSIAECPTKCPTLGNYFGTMAYNADGTRLFTCGIGDDGVAHAEQWNDEAGTLVRSYVGFGKQCNGVAQFDIANSRFLAVGEEYMIKFWDVDHDDLLTTTKAGGGLPALPCIRFNKSGSLLVVSTNDNYFKVLANNDGQQLFVVGNQSNVVPGPSSDPTSKNRESPTSRDAHNSVPEELNDGSSTWKPAKVQKRCRHYSLRLPDRAAKWQPENGQITDETHSCNG